MTCIHSVLYVVVAPPTVDSELISKLVPHVPRLVLVDPSFAGRADSVPYRVTSSLASLVPPAVAKMEAKVGTTGATTTIATSS